MFGFGKKPPASASASPMHSADETPARRTASEPKLNFDDMSVQELEDYAVNQAEDTTRSVNNCLKIAEDIRKDGAKTLETLHQQGEQIHRTHEMAVEMDRDLSKGEKLLNNLGGMFSMPWKPKKTKEITGPQTSKDDNHRGKKGSKEQREKLGLNAKGKSAPTAPPNEPQNAMQKVEMEKAKQDDALDDLSDILGDLKGMATDMGQELDRQNKALDNLDTDIDELNSRVKGANQRARHLLAK
ncbi:putative SNAP25 homologous protein SNAP30 [Ipomoea triloba]|uniref:putative SNAP25 homologous protein SNAP30 n=1 Tax=Ipomoea triloba TaxID=35885 RepID=UPI00125D6801|nr:putative SNAP25 homologous protein SNAP30 [Ipomoea triloba]